MNDTSWRGWVVAAAIFVLGVGVGVAGTTLIGIRIVRRNLQNPAAARTLAERAAGRIGADLTKSLQLTPDESAQVRTILAQTAANLRGVRLQAAAQAADEIRAGIRKIAAALPPEKRAEFSRLVAHRYERLGLPPPETQAPPASP